jgi:hypothetical protein
LYLLISRFRVRFPGGSPKIEAKKPLLGFKITEAFLFMASRKINNEQYYPVKYWCESGGGGGGISEKGGIGLPDSGVRSF